MPHDLTVAVVDRPGTGAKLCRLLADAGINIKGICGYPARGTSWVSMHVLVEEGEAARALLEREGIEIREMREVLVVGNLEDRPGVLADFLQEFAERGVNIDLIYMAMDSQVVLGTDDMHEARAGIRTVDARYG